MAAMIRRLTAVLAAALAALALGMLPTLAQVQRPDSPPPDRAEPLMGTPPVGSDDEPVTATNPERLLELMRELDYDVTLTVDGIGDPLLLGTISQSPYNLFFYGCTEHLDCGFLLYVAYTPAEGITAEQIDDWNKSRLWGTAYLNDEGEPLLSIAYNLYGGVSLTNFGDTLDWFRVTTEAFEEHLGLSADQPGR